MNALHAESAKHMSIQLSTVETWVCEISFPGKSAFFQYRILSLDEQEAAVAKPRKMKMT